VGGGGPRIFVIAGEPSGDQHAAMLGEALRARRDVELMGVGGRRMREAGFELLYDSTQWSGIGVVESLKRVPMLLSVQRRLVGRLTSSPPDLLVLVDFGAFNVRLARRLAGGERPPILYYFPPRSWQRNADYRGLAGIVDRVATVFEWGEELLRAAGVDGRFVGHPVVDRIQPADAATRAELREELGLAADDLVIGLLPGSRRTEVLCNGRVQLEAARIIAERRPGARFLLSVAPSAPDELLTGLAGRFGPAGRVTTVGGVARIVSAADMVITACGTATLEAAAALTPMIIMYVGTWLMHVEKRLRRFDPEFTGMPNIVVGREVVPELIDTRATAPAIAEAVEHLLSDAGALAAMRTDLRAVRDRLGEPGVSARVADMALEMLGR